MKTRIVAVLILAFACIAGAQAQADTYVELILDASGSMFNKLADGRFRIVAAKEVLADFVTGLPGDKNLHVGLRIYGSQMHPKAEGSCEDSKLFVPLKGLDRKLLLRTIQGTQARGATPIAYSLQLAAKDFPADGDKHIVLVTDGIEGCDGDVRGVVAALEAAGLNIDLHIIGIDLDEEALASFEGLGSLENTQSAAELAAALGNAIEVMEKEEYPVTVTVTRGGVPVEKGVMVTFIHSLEGTEQTLAAGDAGTFTGKMPAGVYTAHITDGAQNAEFDYSGLQVAPDAENTFAFDVQPLPEVSLTVSPTDPQAGSAVEVRFENAPAEGKHWITVVPAEADDNTILHWAEVSGASGSAEVATPDEPQTLEARYVLLFPGGGTRVIGWSESFESHLPEVSLEAPASVTSGATIEVVWSGPDNKNDYVTIVPADAPEGTRGNFFFTERGSPGKLLAPEKTTGTHEIRYVTGQSEKTLAAIEVDVAAAGASLSVPEKVPAGSAFEVAWQGPANKDDYLTIAPPDAGARTNMGIAYIKPGESPVSMTAPDVAGPYEVRYITAQTRTILTATAFQATEVTATLKSSGAAKAGEKFTVQWEGPGNKNDYITLVPVGAEEKARGPLAFVGTTNEVTITAPKEPGSYELRYITGQARKVLVAVPLSVTP